MLQTFSFVELVLFGLVWVMIGALPGFYLFAAMNRSPRTGASVGGVIGAVLGYSLVLTGLVSDIQAMMSAVLLLWGICLLLGILLAVTRIGNGNYSGVASLRQSTADLAYGLLLPTFVIVIAIVVFPIIWNAVLAFRPVRTIDLPTLRVFSLDGLTLDNFSRVFQRSETFFEVFWPALVDSVILLALLGAGWFGGRLIARRSGLEPGIGTWIGLLVALVAVIVVAGQQNYVDLINSLLAGRTFLNTLVRTFIYTLTGTMLAIGLGTIAALLVKDKFRGRNLVRGFMLFPYVAPIVSVVFIWKLILNAQFGLVNELIASAGGQRIDFLSQSSTAFLMIVLFQGWRYFPFAFLFILARIQAIPDDMYEAAKVDGAAPSQRLMYITLPQLRAVFGTLFVLRFIWTFNKFDDVFLLTGGAANTQLVTIEIFNQLFSRNNIGMSAAVAVVLALVLIVVVGVYFKWFLVEEN